MEKEHYVYCITNIINGRKYIGSHSGKIDDNYMGSGVNIKLAIKKWGKENFIKDILWIGPQKNLREMETYWCKYFDTGNNPLFYNCSSVGIGWEAGKKNPKLSQWRKENNIESFFKGKTKETNGSLMKISENLKGKPSGMKGKVAWNKGLTGMGGWKFSEEDRKKLYWERKKIQCEHCGKIIGENNYKVHLRKNHMSKKIIDNQIGRKISEKLQRFIYVAEKDSDRIEGISSREIANILNIDRGTVLSKIKSGRKTKNGYIIYRNEIKKDPF